MNHRPRRSLNPGPSQLDGKRRQLGKNCPDLRRADGTWNPRHGSWMIALSAHADQAEAGPGIGTLAPLANKE